MNKRDVVRHILGERTRTPKPEGAAYAPSNIALCKYWGKRNEELFLPVTSSLSISLGALGTHTRITLNSRGDAISLNGEPVPPHSQFARRTINYLDLFRPGPDSFFTVITRNTIPTAAGLASSASGFAALILALDDLLGWALDRKSLSILARLGSGSACRSVYDGFVEWHVGVDAAGMDSFAEPLEDRWPDLRVGLLHISSREKEISSRKAMDLTRKTSALYEAWPIKVAHDLVLIKEAIAERNFDLFGRLAESNALAMHATAMAAWPPVLYWRPESVAAMHHIWALREQGLRLYFTMDAGPNLKLLFLAGDAPRVQEAFPDVEIVAPFGAAASG